MPKAKTIDRLQLTMSHSKFLQNKEKKQYKEGYSTCPGCQHNSLRHETGCAICEHCGWSACD